MFFRRVLFLDWSPNTNLLGLTPTFCHLNANSKHIENPFNFLEGMILRLKFKLESTKTNKAFHLGVMIFVWVFFRGVFFVHYRGALTWHQRKISVYFFVRESNLATREKNWKIKKCQWKTAFASENVAQFTPMKIKIVHIKNLKLRPWKPKSARKKYPLGEKWMAPHPLKLYHFDENFLPV